MRTLSECDKTETKRNKKSRNMKTTRLIDLVRNYLDAEDLFAAGPTEARGHDVIRLRERLRTELNWLNKRRAESLARIEP